MNKLLILSWLLLPLISQGAPQLRASEVVRDELEVHINLPGFGTKPGRELAAKINSLYVVSLDASEHQGLGSRCGLTVREFPDFGEDVFLVGTISCERQSGTSVSAQQLLLLVREISKATKDEITVPQIGPNPVVSGSN